MNLNVFKVPEEKYWQFANGVQALKQKNVGPSLDEIGPLRWREELGTTLLISQKSKPLGQPLPLTHVPLSLSLSFYLIQIIDERRCTRERRQREKRDGLYIERRTGPVGRTHTQAPTALAPEAGSVPPLPHAPECPPAQWGVGTSWWEWMGERCTLPLSTFIHIHFAEWEETGSSLYPTPYPPPFPPSKKKKETRHRFFSFKIHTHSDNGLSRIVM